MNAPPSRTARPPVMVSRALPVAAVRAFAWVADPRTHPHWIPATRIAGPTNEPGVGREFIMVSGPRGRAGFTDRMVTELLDPPTATASGQVRVRKLGPVLHGTAGFVVRSEGPNRCRVLWWEAVRIGGPPVGMLTRPFVDAALRVMMTVSLRRLARRLGGWQ